MTPHRRKGSPYWQVSPRVTLPGHGRIRLPARSTRTRSKAQADAMARTLQELPAMGYADLLERYLADPTLSPAEIHAAKLAGSLEELRVRGEDPPLLPLLRGFSLPDGPANGALARLPDLIRDIRHERGETGEPRLSWLLDARNVQAVLEAREAQGVKRNSVHRCERRGIMEFLTARVGDDGRAKVFAEVRFPKDEAFNRAAIETAIGEDKMSPGPTDRSMYGSN